MIEPSSRNKLPWSGERRKAAVELFHKGLSPTRIAQHLGGVSGDSVRRMLHAANAMSADNVAMRAAKGVKTKTLNTDASPPERLALRRFSWDQDNGLNNG